MEPEAESHGPVELDHVEENFDDDGNLIREIFVVFNKNQRNQRIVSLKDAPGKFRLFFFPISNHSFLVCFFHFKVFPNLFVERKL